MSENFERLGNYILLEKINAGGMAEVYLSKSVGANGINKFLAIKRILPQFADNREFIEMFKEEAKIAVNLNHNNVVSIIDFKASQNQLYIVMEYVQGQNLRQILQQKKKKGLSLSLDFICYVVREIAAGLDHAHRCVDKGTGKPLNIIHRDMSPQNVMISYDGEVKIVDFGIAKAEAAGESTRVGTLKGKFSYMSPEQAEGLVIDQSSDIFSLGIILWELIADDRLFVANNEMNILKRIKECDVPELRRVNPTVPAELERIVKKTLMKDKSLRYQTSTDLQKDLTRFLNKEYPDFTPSDFSTFMKFLFETEYSTAQERMVNYAKLDFGSLNEVNESTQLSKVSKPIPAPPSPFAPDIPPPIFTQPPQPPVPDVPPPNVQDAPPPMNFTNSAFDVSSDSPPIDPFANMPAPTPNRIDTGLSKIQNAPTQIGHYQPVRNSTQTGLNKNTGITQNTGFGQNTGIRKPVPGLAPKRPSGGTANYHLATRSGVTSTGIRYRAPAKPPTSEFAKAAFSFVIVALILGGTYTVLPKKKKAQFTTKVIAMMDRYLNTPTRRSNQKQSQTPETTGTEEISSKATLKMLIKSNPGRARIYVNSQDQGVTTPATIEVEANKPFTLTLLADGYLQYSTRLTAQKDGQEHSADLTPVKFGYLNINVINAGVETIIYIDNLEIKDRNHIEKFPVQSGRPITIKAVHPFLNTQAETTVTVGVDEKKTVDLILTSPAREKTEKPEK